MKRIQLAFVLTCALLAGPPSVASAQQAAGIHLEVKAANGTTEKWMIEAGAPNAMFRRGFKKDSLPTGTEVVVDGYRARDGSTKANGRIITFKDGRRLFVSGTDEGAFK